MTKKAFELLNKQLEALFEGESDLIANMANMSALLYDTLPNINWVGFYLRQKDELVLGPFQGKVACVRIPWGKGVCGSAAAQKAALLVKDVHTFAGHIACDPASRSELVIPLIVKGEVKAVLDIDSPHLARFDENDKYYLQKLCETFVRLTDFGYAL